MKSTSKISNTIILIVRLLFILLFSYAAVSKLLDYETFERQLGQSPLLSDYAGLVSVGIIVIELIVSGLLMFHKTGVIGLYLSFFIMVMFTTYIIVILNFSPSIPCSCGGVLDALGWSEHLIFNVFFIGVALIGILIERKQKHDFN
ncbi:MauE/DoxX family redox-associated membrane protein [Gelidibacter pelagius]|uniref:Methylamine utilisation protein MauE domain-containing protein n=1 Tax=Gelidibacter pelagius TaxID=2819985 RepID=A0ABS3SX17_9FLAO|nr:MauE/DoxX family redox-associated membrane protein [Gelidibacter pelagius]MBO3100263.1 hypothetical protein [Gelidibacter pelagius]